MASSISELAPKLRSILPAWGQQPVIGLSIEGNDLRLICVQGREIVRLVSRSLPRELFPDGLIADAQAFAQAVRSALSEYEIPRRRIVAGFPDPDARSRLLTLPRDASTKIAEIVKREARHDPVMGRSDYRIFHQIVQSTTTQMTVFVLAVRRLALDSFVSGLRMANATPDKVELRSLAMIRAINQPHIIIAHAERTSLDVIIVSNNLPVIMRSVPVADSDAHPIHDVVSELERTIDSYNINHPHPLSQRLPVALTGELSADLDLQAAVQERLGHPLAELTCPFACPPGFAIANFIVNIGLVLGTR